MDLVYFRTLYYQFTMQTDSRIMGSIPLFKHIRLSNINNFKRDFKNRHVIL